MRDNFCKYIKIKIILRICCKNLLIGNDDLSLNTEKNNVDVMLIKPCVDYARTD